MIPEYLHLIPCSQPLDLNVAWEKLLLEALDVLSLVPCDKLGHTTRGCQYAEKKMQKKYYLENITYCFICYHDFQLRIGKFKNLNSFPDWQP